MVAAFVASASAAATSLTLPTHQAGDLLVMAALRSGSNQPVTIPSEWISCGNVAGLNSDNLVTAFCVANAAGSLSGTWTNAAMLACFVYRHDTNIITLSQRSVQRSAGGGTNTPAYREKVARTDNYTNVSNSDQMMQSSGVLLGIIGSVSVAFPNSVAPTGMTNRTAESASTFQIACHDTTTGVSSWTNKTATLSGAVPWLTHVLEIVDTKFIKSGNTSRPSHPMYQQVIG